MDLLLVGLIHTLDAARPRAEAVLVREGRLACVGTRAECGARAGAGALKVDLGAGSAVPGLADAHGHVLGLGRSLEEVSCEGARDAADCAARAGARAAALPAGAWLRGRGWDQNLWPGGAFPDERALSAAVPDRPALLARVDGHAAWVNARGLEAAGIDRKTPDPPGGRILRRPDGTPSGVLVDAAMERATSRIPEPSPAERERLLSRALAALAAVGLTSVHDAGVDAETLEAYARLARADRLPLRVYAMLDGMAPEAALKRQIERWSAEPQVGRLEVRAAKLYADGALGSRGAALLEPYADDPGNSGLLLLSPAELRARIRLLARAGLQPAVHAIGDRACREVLAAFEEIEAEIPLRQLRPRVEHLQILRPEDAPRLSRTGAVASMQPTHAVSDGAWAERRLGRDTPARAGAYAWRRALRSAAALAFGSDFPVESPDPRLGLRAAEERIPRGASAPWMPEERLERIEALRAFTAGAAWAAFAEGRRGVIREGADADLTLLDVDLLGVPAARLAEVGVRATIVGGRMEYRRSPRDPLPAPAPSAR